VLLGKQIWVILNKRYRSRAFLVVVAEHTCRMVGNWEVDFWIARNPELTRSQLDTKELASGPKGSPRPCRAVV
jgi:hypothetical protein